LGGRAQGWGRHSRRAHHDRNQRRRPDLRRLFWHLGSRRRRLPTCKAGRRQAVRRYIFPHVSKVPTQTTYSSIACIALESAGYSRSGPRSLTIYARFDERCTNRNIPSDQWTSASRRSARSGCARGRGAC
jgi:hypothetical protein